MRRVGLFLLLVAMLVVATATAAAAAPITRTTQSHFIDMYHGDFPCLGTPGRQDDAATITYDTKATCTSRQPVRMLTATSSRRTTSC